MSRMNSRNRKKYLAEIVRRSGGLYCFIGGEGLPSDDAIIDHWDNDNSNNDPLNLHIICASMNAVKNPRGRDKHHQILSPIYGNMYERIWESEPQRTNSIQIIKSLQAEPDFRHWLFWKVVHDGKVSFEDALDTGAAFARCSQETIRRYIKKEVSEVRLYQLVEDPDSRKKIIQLKPQWATFRKKEEDRMMLEKQARNWKDDVIREMNLIPPPYEILKEKGAT